MHLTIKSRINRVDLARYLILYKYGGFFIDLDMECLKPLDRFTQFGGLIVAKMSDNDTQSYAEHNIPNSWMASTKGHPLLEDILTSLSNRYEKDTSVESTTGSIFLYREINKYQTRQINEHTSSLVADDIIFLDAGIL